MTDGKFTIHYDEETDTFDCPQCEIKYEDARLLVAHMIEEEH